MKYSKGDVVFSRCKNELPWPSVITKVALNNRVKANFFGERFYAYMGMKAVSQFNERNVKKALRRKNAKLIRAVKLAQ